MRALAILCALALAATGAQAVIMINPNPADISAMDLTPALVEQFTATNGAGTRYARCRVGASSACDAGLQCCGYLGSQLANGAEGGHKLPDTCVVKSPLECPRTVVGAAGGPCGKRGECATGLVCCKTVLFLNGAAGRIPTCQNPKDSCPSKPCHRRGMCGWWSFEH